MKKLVCGCFGNIYYATILKNGMMSSNDRIEMTDEAVDAVFQHIVSMEGYEEKGFAGYDINKKTGGEVCLCVFDRDKYELVKKTESEGEKQ